MNNLDRSICPAVVQEQQRQIQNHEDLDAYRKLGVLETFIIQGDDDEDCEQRWMAAIGLSPEETLYAVEAGAALKELRDRNKKAHQP